MELKDNVKKNTENGNWFENIRPLIDSYINEKIIPSKYIQQLKEGSLDKKVFGKYTSQDILYCLRYGESFIYTAAKSKVKEHEEFFERGGSRSIEKYPFDLEKNLKRFNLEKETKMNDVCEKYSTHEWNSVHKSYGVGIASLISCYYVYNMVDIYLWKYANKTSDYSFMFYEIYDIKNSTKTIINIANSVAKKNPEKVREMNEALTLSTKYELELWNSAFE